MEIRPALAPYVPLARMLAQTFGQDCEVVLHDLDCPEHSVVHVENPSVTGRKVGQSFDQLVRQVILSNELKEDFVANYYFTAPNGKHIRSSTLLIRDGDGRLTGALCLNLDTTRLTQQIAYLQSLGWEVEPTPILEQEITMPKDFPDVLKQYNELQRQQGFDLEEYAGKKLTLYTYRITNHPDAEEADASLYVYRSELVGGDVHSTSFTGFMTALR